MFDLEAYSNLVQEAYLVIFDQCGFGCVVKKPTMLLYRRCAAWTLSYACSHELAWHTEVPGREYFAPHPRCLGKRNGKFATKQSAAYPVDLNRELASVVAGAIADMPQIVLVMCSGPTRHQTTFPVCPGHWALMWSRYFE